MTTPAETPLTVGDDDLSLDEAVPVDLSDAFEPERPVDDLSPEPAFLEMFGRLLIEVGGDGSGPSSSGGGEVVTTPIVRGNPIAWDGADPWASLGLAPPLPEDSARLLGLIVKTLVDRGLLDVREVADVLVPPVRPG